MPPSGYNMHVHNNFACMWCHEASSCCPSTTSASPAPTGQSNITQSTDIDYNIYTIYMRCLKMPRCVAAMLQCLVLLSRADNFSMICYRSSSLVPFHAKVSTALHRISARISDSWASQPNKPNVHCQFELNNLY